VQGGSPRPVPLPLRVPIAEAAAHLGISAATVRRRIKRGELRARRRTLPGGYQLLVELEAPTPPGGPGTGAGPELEPPDVEPSGGGGAPQGLTETPAQEGDRIDTPASGAAPAGVVGRLEVLVDELRRRADDQAAELARLHARLAAVEADARAERESHHKQLTAALTLLGHRLALEAGGVPLPSPVVDIVPAAPGTRPGEGTAHAPVEGATQPTADAVESPLQDPGTAEEGTPQAAPPGAQGSPQAAQGAEQHDAQGVVQAGQAGGGTGATPAPGVEGETPGWWRRVLAWLRG
jgi:hypothetical protein